MPALLVERLLGLTGRRHQLLTCHGLIHLVFLLGGLAGYILAFRLFDNRVLAMFAMLVFLFHPRLYAHSFFNSKDIPFASMFLIALCLVQRAFRQYTVVALVVLGVGVGAATNLRIKGMVLFPIVVALRAGYWCVEAPARRHILRTMVAFVGAQCGEAVHAVAISVGRSAAVRRCPLDAGPSPNYYHATLPGAGGLLRGSAAAPRPHVV